MTEAATVETAPSWKEWYGRETRVLFRELLVELAEEDERIVCVDSDMGGLEDGFGATFPSRYFNVGIAEANMTGVAAGLAASGYIPFVHAISSFAAARACEQLKIDVASNCLPVRIVATHAGLSAGHYGPTHHALEDIAIVRALPNMTLVVPADGVETEAAVRAVADLPGPAYLRLGRKPTPILHNEPMTFELGRAVQLRDGDDAAIVATGPWPVRFALDAAETLAADGVEARVLDLHTVKPLDVEALVEAAETTCGIVTVEDHVVTGGVGGAVCEAVAATAPCRVLRVGAADRFLDDVGDELDLLERAGVSAERVVEAVRTIVEEAA
jgi:transketolase